MRLLAIEGVSIARLGNFHIKADLQAGRLVPLLQAYNPGDTAEVNAVFVKEEACYAALPSGVNAVA